MVVYTAAENKTRTHASRELFLANYIYTPDPWKGCLGSLGQNLIILKTKRLAFSQPFDFERKTRLEPTLWTFLANYIYTPSPWKGRLGSLGQNLDTHRYKTKTTTKRLSFLVLSGKRDSNSRPQPWQNHSILWMIPQYI